MSKKKILYLLLAVLSIAIILVLLLNLRSVSPGNPPTNSETPEEPIFIIPENPLGTIGLLSALALAFGIFALKKKKT